MQEVFGTSRQRRVYREYLRSPEWQRKREMVMQRAMQPCMPESPKIDVSFDRYGRRIESIAVEWKRICEHVRCLNVAKDVHL